MKLTTCRITVWFAGMDPPPAGTAMSNEPVPVAPGVYVDMPCICSTPLISTVK